MRRRSTLRLARSNRDAALHESDALDGDGGAFCAEETEYNDEYCDRPGLYDGTAPPPPPPPPTASARIANIGRRSFTGAMDGAQGASARSLADVLKSRNQGGNEQS